MSNLKSPQRKRGVKRKGEVGWGLFVFVHLDMRREMGEKCEGESSRGSPHRRKWKS
jgi:hypothetical protein